MKYEEKAKRLLSGHSSITKVSIGSTKPLLSPLRIHTGEAAPVFSKCRPLHGDKKSQVEDELRKWEKDGIIQRVSEEVEWASPIHAVKKKPRGPGLPPEWRVCGDFQRLNAITSTDRYPLPPLTSFNAKLSGCRVFSKVDLKRAYHQVPVAECDQVKTTINTTLGLFKFVRMPFGLKNAGSYFMRNIHHVLKGLQFVFIYMDDLMIASRSFEDHICHLKQVFQKLEEFKILVNVDKCEFARPQLEFLGHIVDQNGISIPDHRVEAIQRFPKPQTKKELERFLGLYAFVHRFIKGASGIVAALHELRKVKGKQVLSDSWLPIHDKAFDQAKTAIVKTTLLAHPRKEPLLKSGPTPVIWLLEQS